MNAETQPLFDAVREAQRTQNWEEAGLLCRQGAAATTPDSEECCIFRLELLYCLSKLGIASAIDETIAVCQTLLANTAVPESILNLPIIHMMLADAFADKPSEKREDNLRKAIVHYCLAQDSMDREREPVLQANLAIRHGAAYLQLSRETNVPKNELTDAATRLRDAREVFKQHNCDDLLGEADWVLKRLDKLIAKDGVVDAESRTAKAMLVQGKVLIEHGEADSAITAFSEAVLLDPELDEAYFRRGDVYQERGNYEKAIADYTAVMRLGPSNAVASAAYDNRGLAYLKMGKFDAAVQDHTKAIELRPENAVSFYNRGNAYGERGDSEKAIEDYSQAIRLDSTLAAAYHNRAYELQRLNDIENAIADLTTAIHLSPQDSHIFTSRGVAYKKKGDLDKAFADYTEAIRLAPDNKAARSNRGNIYLMGGDLDNAIADYTAAIRIDPQFADAYYGRGKAYAEKADNSNAIADFSKVLKLNPQHSRAYYQRGISHAKIGNRPKADEDFAAAKRLGYVPFGGD